jgi:hypothetical protein
MLTCLTPYRAGASVLADTVHPNDTGHALIARCVMNTLAGKWVRYPSLNFASIAAGGVGTLTVTVLGARAGVGMQVTVTPPSTLEAGLVLRLAAITADDTVTLALLNTTAGAIDPAAAVWTVAVHFNP